MREYNSFYLTGDFNNWRPADPACRFEEVTAPYGLPNAPDTILTLGSYHITTTLPRGRIRFKITQNGSWDHQWSVWNSYDDAPYDITKYRFETRIGLPVYSIFYRGKGMPPHAAFDYRGGAMRWDFHPDSLTLAIHNQLHLRPGMTAGFWRRFSCGSDMEYETWYCLPYGYDDKGSYRYPVCLMFDGRGLLYGEEDSPWHHVSNDHDRQWPRALDILARHGVITPVVVIAVGVPRYAKSRPAQEHRNVRWLAYADYNSPAHKALAKSICEDLLPEATQRFSLSSGPDDYYLAGHSNGGDMALNLLAYDPKAFSGAVAISPGSPSLTNRLAQLPPNVKDRIRIALSYSSGEPTPGFRTDVAGIRKTLSGSGLHHLVVYLPEATHSPASVFKFLPGCFAFVMS